MVEALFGVILGFVLAIGYERTKVRMSCKAHWGVLKAEIGLCEKTAKQYINRTVSAPLYRFPIIAFKSSFATLVGYADLSPEEFENLSKFFSWCEDINRGLDTAHEMAITGNDKRLATEEKRINAKCIDLLSDYLQPAYDAVSSHE